MSQIPDMLKGLYSGILSRTLDRSVLLVSLIEDGCSSLVSGGGGGEGVTSYIWHSTDVHVESALPGIWLVPFFKQKVYGWPEFSGFVCERPHFSDIFWSEIFRGCCSQGIQWIDCDIWANYTLQRIKYMKYIYVSVVLPFYWKRV